MDKNTNNKYTIAVAGTGAGEIIGTTRRKP